MHWMRSHSAFVSGPKNRVWDHGAFRGLVMGDGRPVPSASSRSLSVFGRQDFRRRGNPSGIMPDSRTSRFRSSGAHWDGVHGRQAGRSTTRRMTVHTWRQICASDHLPTVELPSSSRSTSGMTSSRLLKRSVRRPWVIAAFPADKVFAFLRSHAERVLYRGLIIDTTTRIRPGGTAVGVGTIHVGLIALLA